MEQNTFITGPCPTCGRQLQIPGELEEFSCMYCGARLRREDLAPVPEGDPAEGLAQARELLPKCVTNYPCSIRYLTAKDFPNFFAKYEGENTPAFAALELAFSQNSAETALRSLAMEIVDAIGEWTRGRRRELDDARCTMCLFMIPALKKQGTFVSERFAEHLVSAWMERHPEVPFQAGTYEEIMAGFRRKKLCFITTAACDYAGKADDCPELTAFRQFRDGYLARQPEGPALIQEYYNLAPGIVTAINLTGDRDREYSRIWEQELTPCYEDLLAGRERQCMDRYCAMVRRLERDYLGLQ